jgi:CubicO group peptidase (beta-lactamase class C family)
MIARIGLRCVRLLILTTLCLTGWQSDGTAAEEGPPQSASEMKLRTFLTAEPTASSYVFVEGSFPDIRLNLESATKEHLGDYSLRTIFYDRQAQRVTSPDKPGPFAALVEIVPASGRSTYRTLTLYRLEKPLPAEESVSFETLPRIAECAGLKSESVKSQGTLIVNLAKNHTFAGAVKNRTFARLLAGISLSGSIEPVRKNLDALTTERQWWTTIRRRAFHLEDKFPTQLDRPKTIPGLDAIVIREGSLAEAGMQPDAAAKIDAALKAWSADTDEAFAVCIVRHGVIVHHQAYGKRADQPMTLTTKSWMASVTKAMSATLMMMLVDQGILKLDNGIDQFIPALKGISVSQPLTIRHLYTHTNGLDKWPGWNDERADVEFLLADAYPSVSVGKYWGYNGLGYTLGGKVMENITGEAIPALYLKHLLEPLGCVNTDVVATHADAMSVPLDMAKFGQMLLNRGSYGDLQFMRPETFELMLPQRLTKTLGPSATKSFGIGLDGQPDTRKFGHGAASAATFSVDANDDLVVVMTRNKIGKNYDKYNGIFWQAIQDSIIRPTAK